MKNVCKYQNYVYLCKVIKNINDMKAIIKKTGLEVYIREEFTAQSIINQGMVCVSKQKEGNAYFCVNKYDLELITK